MGTNFFFVTSIGIIVIICYAICKFKRKKKDEYKVDKSDPMYQSLSPEERQFINEWSEEMNKRNS